METLKVDRRLLERFIYEIAYKYLTPEEFNQVLDGLCHPGSKRMMSVQDQVDTAIDIISSLP